MKQSENQLTEIPTMAFPPSFSSENSILSSDVNNFTSLRSDREDVGGTVSSANTLRQIPLSGVVEAILEVGNQRKTVLSRLRAALVCGNDSEALCFARQICGLAI